MNQPTNPPPNSNRPNGGGPRPAGEPGGSGRRRRRGGRGGGDPNAPRQGQQQQRQQQQGQQQQGQQRSQQQQQQPRQQQRPGLDNRRQQQQQQQQQQQRPEGGKQQHQQQRGNKPPPPPQKPALPTPSALAVAQDAGPMAPQEVAEMRHHLAFIRTHRAVLRLQLNAAEDLLVNGQRDPADRGVCRHLLDKVDRSCIEGALAREPVKSDPKARATLLAGAVALSRDVGILITYLETLTQLTSRADQARAFVEAVGRIDFEALSAARLSRLMQLLLDIFDGTSRTQVLLGLLEQSVFRRAVDLAFSQLGDDVQDALRPLRILGQLVFREGAARTADEQAAVRSALDAVMALPPVTLKALSVPVRTGLLDAAVNLTGSPALLDRVMDGLLPELPRDGRDHSRITTRYAAQLLARQDDVRAKNVLELVVKAHPDFRQPARWLAELQLPRVGRVAVKDATPRAGLTRGFFLDAQEEVWLRTTPLANSAALNDEARLQLACALPGVARVVATFSHGELACCAVTAAGHPLNLGSLPKMDAERRVVLGQMLRVVNALALAGLTLPDVRCERWLFHAQPAVVTLADVSGLEHRGAGATTLLRDAARALFQQLLPAAVVPPDADLAALVQAAESTAQPQ